MNNAYLITQLNVEKRKEFLKKNRMAYVPSRNLVGFYCKYPRIEKDKKVVVEKPAIQRLVVASAIRSLIF